MVNRCSQVFVVQRSGHLANISPAHSSHSYPPDQLSLQRLVASPWAYRAFVGTMSRRPAGQSRFLNPLNTRQLWAGISVCFAAERHTLSSCVTTEDNVWKVCSRFNIYDWDAELQSSVISLVGNWLMGAQNSTPSCLQFLTLTTNNCGKRSTILTSCFLNMAPCITQTLHTGIKISRFCNLAALRLLQIATELNSDAIGLP